MTFLSLILGNIAVMARPALFNLYFAGAAIPVGFALAIFIALGKNSTNMVLNRLSRGRNRCRRGSGGSAPCWWSSCRAQ